MVAEETAHFRVVVEARQISRAWIDFAIEPPDDVEEKADGTRHYLKQIPQFGNRWLRVVVNVVDYQTGL